MRQHSYELYLGPEYTDSTPDEIRLSHIPKEATHSPTPPRPMRRRRAYRCPIYRLSPYGETLAWYESIAEASRKTGIGTGNISNALHNPAYTAGGFRWEYDKKAI